MVFVIALHLAMAGYLARQSLQTPGLPATPDKNRVQFIFLPPKERAIAPVVNPVAMPKPVAKVRPPIPPRLPSPVVVAPRPLTLTQQDVVNEAAPPPSTPPETAVGNTARTLFPDAALLKRIAKESEPDTGKLHGNTPAPSPMGKLAQGIAAAAKPRQTTMVDIRQGDGRVITKVTGPNGTWCVMASATPSALSRGEGPRTIPVNCPKE